MVKKILRFIGKTLLWLIGLSVLWVLVYKWVPVPVTPLMVIRSFEKTSPNKNGWKHEWKSIENISVNLQKAVICSEDQNFVSHNGFDFKAIDKAWENNKKGRRVRGASTISQQTAKNVFLWPSRSWFRKALETYFTFLIETLWSKERILEVYLNSIEMGNGVYGAQAASEYWFHKNANQLTANQAAALAAILPNPRSYKANPPTPYIQRRVQWITQQMYFYGPLQLTPKEKQN